MHDKRGKTQQYIFKDGYKDKKYIKAHYISQIYWMQELSPFHSLHLIMSNYLFSEQTHYDLCQLAQTCKSISYDSDCKKEKQQK